jgi:serine/threonine protein kinase
VVQSCNISLCTSLQNEFTVLEKLKHPHIVEVFELKKDYLFENDKHWIMIEEYAPCGTLFDYLKGNEFIIPTIKQLFMQIVESLSFVHSTNICHLDMKLENILMFDKHYLKLADFGYAQHLHTEEDGSTKPINVFCGTRYYIAPEVHKCQENESVGYDGKKADIFSLGVIL